ncbi:MAG: protein kinase, partial [Deltaproteobacteria bacterium]|nr:protein kinase [Deltaproteobacteria bacterium]
MAARTLADPASFGGGEGLDRFGGPDGGGRTRDGTASRTQTDPTAPGSAAVPASGRPAVPASPGGAGPTESGRAGVRTETDFSGLGRRIFPKRDPFAASAGSDAGAVGRGGASAARTAADGGASGRGDASASRTATDGGSFARGDSSSSSSSSSSSAAAAARTALDPGLAFRDAAAPGGGGPPFGGESFRGYPVERLLSSEGGEADIMVIRDGEGREYVLRLYREGREPAPGVMGKLVELSKRRSPYVVNTYEAGRDEGTGRFYEIQEYLPEGDLERWAAGRKVTGAEFWELASQLCEAVSIVHGQGLAHRDIKPDNILLRSRSPLRVALADFGISSAADPSGRSRETRTAATPLYSPPESFAGFAGPAGDWWSLGAVLLECAAGGHPLAGLPLNMVMREIGSRGIRVPEDLDASRARLLKGLLTRDDARRWGLEEVRAWLEGRRDLPVHYEGDLALSAQGGEGGFSRPFVFMGTAYRSPGALAGAFAAGPAAWGPAAASLSRGQVRDWLEENRAYDEAVSMEDPEAGEPDIALYSFILLFRPDLGHVWRGERLSLDYFAEALSSDSNTPSAEFVAGELVSGRLRALPAAAERRGRPMPPLLRILLESELAPPPGPLAALGPVAGLPPRREGLTREPTVEWPPRGGGVSVGPAAER